MKKLNDMKPWKVAAGILAELGLLAIICAVFPENGLAITDTVSLRFPTLTEMLDGDTVVLNEEELMTPEELLAKRAADLKASKEQEFVEYFTKNPARIHFPGNDFSYFDPVYAALENAHEEGMHIVHYGDSQLEGDRMSYELRLTLQERFGGGGNGLLPWKESLYSQTINMHSEVAPRCCQVFGPKSQRREGSTMYGPMGAVSLVDTAMTVSLSGQRRKGKPYIASHYFNRLTILTRCDSASLRLSAQGQSKTIAPSNNAMDITTFALKDSTTAISISVSGKGDIYGIVLDMDKGVSVDNIPMRGCSGTIFTGINTKQMTDFFQYTNTKMIILQFAGNSMPYLKTQQGIDNYVGSLRKQLRHVKSLAPDCQILWIGPSDMSTRINGQYTTYPLLRALDQSICKMVNEEGSAYWSLFESMGGNNSMVRWVETSPALASKDYIHFTRLGAQKAGELLTEAFMAGYTFYTFRHPAPVVEEMPTDSIVTE